MNNDLISRQQVIDEITEYGSKDTIYMSVVELKRRVEQLPSVQPFHNITMNDVLKYIDEMPEDVWQEFTAYLECRGWELQRRTAKWCGGNFA